MIPRRGRREPRAGPAGHHAVGASAGGAARVVIDTNVFVGAAFRKSSASARLLSAVRSGAATLVWDAPTRDETRAVLGRIPRLSWDAVADLFREEARFTGETRPEGFGRIADPADRKFAALAAAAGCTLVSSDRHLLDHRDSLGVPVLTPGELMSGAV
ncbi:MAG TPA: PIN domain-containing protein [Thermohalobaculum sp.]|nr:PIN domain-containing protein [Thermohalobaculum sp.]